MVQFFALTEKFRKKLRTQLFQEDVDILPQLFQFSLGGINKHIVIIQ